MTNNPLVPWIEALDSCADDAARAQWLLTAPYSQLMTYEFTIRNRLRSKGFALGVRYLDLILLELRTPRVKGDVVLSNEIYSALSDLTTKMLETAFPV